MIADWFIQLASVVLGWALDTFPPFDDSGIVITAENFFLPWLGGIHELGVWMPWNALRICVPIVMTVYLVSLLARFFRVILGHIPLIGGNG